VSTSAAMMPTAGSAPSTVIMSRNHDGADAPATERAAWPRSWRTGSTRLCVIYALHKLPIRRICSGGA
jgi:hypothetical protein